MSIEEAIRLLRAQYEKDKQCAWIYNPVAHALYEVWKKADVQPKFKKQQRTLDDIHEEALNSLDHNDYS